MTHRATEAESAPSCPPMREIEDTRQVAGESPRRWYFSHEQDLLIWTAGDGSIEAFQLSYNKPIRQMALRWRHGKGFRHYYVDEERHDLLGGTPLLLEGLVFDAATVVPRFISGARLLPIATTAFVIERLYNVRADRGRRS